MFVDGINKIQVLFNCNLITFRHTIYIKVKASIHRYVSLYRGVSTLKPVFVSFEKSQNHFIYTKLLYSIIIYHNKTYSCVIRSEIMAVTRVGCR